MHAYVTDGQIRNLGRLPNAARRLDTDEWVMGLPTASPALVEATGWHQIQQTERPTDTATTTHDRSVDLVDGRPTVVWTGRPKTADEIAADERSRNQATIEQAARQAITQLRTIRDASSMTNAQAVAAIKVIARNQIQVIRLLVNDLDVVD